MHTVNPETAEVERIKLQRDDVLPYFVRHAPCRVAMEACGSAHWWARKLTALGHEVRLLPPRNVRPFVLRNKTDAADARAIWTAAQQPDARFVAVKTEAQQAILALHRLRAQLLKFRIMQTNALRGAVRVRGSPARESVALAKALPGALANLEGHLPTVLLDSLHEQWARVLSVDEEIVTLERRLTTFLRGTPACQAVADIPGVGLLTATAAVASLGEAKTFKSGREFAAWVGLVPRQRGTGGDPALSTGALA